MAFAKERVSHQIDELRTGSGRNVVSASTTASQRQAIVARIVEQERAPAESPEARAKRLEDVRKREEQLRAQAGK